MEAVGPRNINSSNLNCKEALHNNLALEKCNLKEIKEEGMFIFYALLRNSP